MLRAVLLVVVVVLVLDLLEAHLLVASFIPRAGTIGSGGTRGDDEEVGRGSSVARGDAARAARFGRSLSLPNLERRYMLRATESSRATGKLVVRFGSGDNAACETIVTLAAEHDEGIVVAVHSPWAGRDFAEFGESPVTGVFAA